MNDGVSSRTPEESQAFRQAAVDAVAEAVGKLDVKPTNLASVPSRFGARRGGPDGVSASVRKMVLVEQGDGALEWRDPDPASASGTPRRGLGDLSAGTRFLANVPVEVLAPNRIVEKLEEWDRKLNPYQGLRRWDGSGGLVGLTTPLPVGPDAGPILLVVHGTFSEGGAIFDQLKSVEANAGFLSWATSRYKQVLSFDHPTLSVSPVLNALDLARDFGEVRAPVDVICHSRGGLVARWWLEAFGGAKVGPRRVVFVASPLGGTSLASPPKIREAFNLFTTVGSHLKNAGAAASVYFPFMTVAVGLMQVFVSVTGAVANSPMADLFFNAVPGLGAMSRVGNNNELARLMSGSTTLPSYFAISSDFQMEKAGWRFWKNFQNLGLRAADWGASQVFDQPNDLVVDNRATIELFKGKGLPPGRILQMPTNGQVYHTNYFLQPEVLGAVRRFLD